MGWNNYGGVSQNTYDAANRANQLKLQEQQIKNAEAQRAMEEAQNARKERAMGWLFGSPNGKPNGGGGMGMDQAWGSSLHNFSNNFGTGSFSSGLGFARGGLVPPPQYLAEGGNIDKSIMQDPVFQQYQKWTNDKALQEARTQSMGLPTSALSAGNAIDQIQGEQYAKRLAERGIGFEVKPYLQGFKQTPMRFASPDYMATGGVVGKANLGDFWGKQGSNPLDSGNMNGHSPVPPMVRQDLQEMNKLASTPAGVLNGGGAGYVPYMTDEMLAARRYSDQHQMGMTLGNNAPNPMAQAKKHGQALQKMGGYYATGGVVGMHPGQPRGTDTVPAWLTPGEAVLNPGATAMMGKGQIDKLNRMGSDMMPPSYHKANGGVIYAPYGYPGDMVPYTDPGYPVPTESPVITPSGQAQIPGEINMGNAERVNPVPATQTSAARTAPTTPAVSPAAALAGTAAEVLGPALMTATVADQAGQVVNNNPALRDASIGQSSNVNPNRDEANQILPESGAPRTLTAPIQAAAEQQRRVDPNPPAPQKQVVPPDLPARQGNALDENGSRGGFSTLADPSLAKGAKRAVYETVKSINAAFNPDVYDQTVAKERGIPQHPSFTPVDPASVGWSNPGKGSDLVGDAISANPKQNLTTPKQIDLQNSARTAGGSPRIVDTSPLPPKYQYAADYYAANPGEMDRYMNLKKVEDQRGRGVSVNAPGLSGSVHYQDATPEQQEKLAQTLRTIQANKMREAEALGNFENSTGKKGRVLHAGPDINGNFIITEDDGKPAPDLSSVYVKHNVPGYSDQQDLGSVYSDALKNAGRVDRSVNGGMQRDQYGVDHQALWTEYPDVNEIRNLQAGNERQQNLDNTMAALAKKDPNLASMIGSLPARDQRDMLLKMELAQQAASAGLNKEVYLKDRQAALDDAKAEKQAGYDIQVDRAKLAQKYPHRVARLPVSAQGELNKLLLLQNSAPDKVAPYLDMLLKSGLSKELVQELGSLTNEAYIGKMKPSPYDPTMMETAP